MTKHICIVAAAALTVAGMGLSARAQQDTAAPTAGQQVENAAEKTGQAIGNAADQTGKAVSDAADKTANAITGTNAEEIRDVLAQVAEASLTKGGLDDVVERFVDADRNRLGEGDALKKENPELDGRIAQFQKDWKAKYNQDFDLKDEDRVYNTSFAMITEGEQTGQARTAGARIDPNTGKAEVTTDGKTGIDAPGVNTNGQTDADKNLNDAGRNIATVTIPASHGLPEVKVPMIHEAGGWKIDVPDSVSAAQLKDNIQAGLTRCDEMKDKWPADADEAYRAVTHEVLAAIFNQKPDGSAAQPAADHQPGADRQPAGAQPVR